MSRERGPRGGDRRPRALTLTPLRAGEVNEELLDLVRTKVRVPEQTIGDLMANVSCTEVGGRMLLELMDDYGLDDLEPLADSGGPGAFRGGLALEIVLGAEGDDAISRAVVALSPGRRGGADPATWARAERTHGARREEAHHDIRRRGVRSAVQPGVERA